MKVALEVLALVAVIGILLGIGALGEKYGKKKEAGQNDDKSQASKKPPEGNDLL
ncbi:MAG TPA: hypothetical protein VIF82_08810 [Burkholderiaceae bacterium]|jgi:hypothetical protein